MGNIVMLVSCQPTATATATASVAKRQVSGYFQEVVTSEDFTEGELLPTKQRPRMQSRAIVISLALGDAAIIPPDAHPLKGRKGVYAGHANQAISRVHRDEHRGLELLPCAPLQRSIVEGLPLLGRPAKPKQWRRIRRPIAGPARRCLD
jgi:hypothetical protein